MCSGHLKVHFGTIVEGSWGGEGVRGGGGGGTQWVLRALSLCYWGPVTCRCCLLTYTSTYIYTPPSHHQANYSVSTVLTCIHYLVSSRHASIQLLTHQPCAVVGLHDCLRGLMQFVRQLGGFCVIINIKMSALLDCKTCYYLRTNVVIFGDLVRVGLFVWPTTSFDLLCANFKLGKRLWGRGGGGGGGGGGEGKSTTSGCRPGYRESALHCP